MNLGEHIAGDVLTADEAYAPWTLAADDVFLGQMIEAAPVVEVADISVVDAPWAVGDRIADLLSGLDDAPLFTANRSAGQDFTDVLIAAARSGQIELPSVDSDDRPEVRPDSEEGPQVLPGVMDDDFLKLDEDHRVALPVEIDDNTFGWRSDGHDMVVYPTALTLNDDGLFVPDHGHGLIGHDDWLF